MQVEIAPNYSEELGWSLKGAAGAYLTDSVALGLIVEYGENKQEYLANAGIQFNDAISLVGNIGMLQQRNDYGPGNGRETVRQMEYGASLKGAYEVGVLSGFEINGYLADAGTDSNNVETGKVYGLQAMTDLDLTDLTHVKVGVGYEWLNWDDGEDNGSVTFSADGSQNLGDVVSLTARAKLGVSENVYGGGVAFDLSNGGMNTNQLGLNFSYIDGHEGIEDDKRVELSWNYGFGAGPVAYASTPPTDSAAPIRAAADVVTVAPANNLLHDVMKRPAYLPETVIARAKGETVDPCSKYVTYNLVDFQPVAQPWNAPVVLQSSASNTQVSVIMTGFTPEELANPQTVSLSLSGQVPNYQSNPPLAQGNYLYWATTDDPPLPPAEGGADATARDQRLHI